jgi:hypothetical protein
MSWLGFQMLRHGLGQFSNVYKLFKAACTKVILAFFDDLQDGKEGVS